MPKADNATHAKARRLAAWEYSIKGKTQQWIANQLEMDGLGRVSQAAVWKMLKRTEAIILERLTTSTNELKARQTETLWLIYSQAIEAWEKSWHPIKTLVTKQVDGVPSADAQLTIRDGGGDPRYLQVALQALDDMRKIWGLNSPIRHKIGGDESSPPIKTETSVDLDGATVEELEQMIELHKRIRARGKSPAITDGTGTEATAQVALPLCEGGVAAD